MHFKASKGFASFLVEVVLVVIIIGAFLYAVKYYNDRERVAVTYYPNQTTTSAVTYSGTTNKPPVGVTVGKGGVTISGQKSGTLSSVDVATVITYTDAGFSPKIVTLSGSGRTVRFINKSSRLMWPLAAPFDSPTFNSEYGLQSGQSFTVTMPPGSRSYAYYNRLNDSHRGVITVP